MLKKFAPFLLITSISAANLAYAKDEVDDLRSNDSTEWSLIKHDTKRQIKAYDKKEYGNQNELSDILFNSFSKLEIEKLYGHSSIDSEIYFSTAYTKL